MKNSMKYSQKNKRAIGTWYAAAVLLLMAAVASGILLGAVKLSATELFEIILGRKGESSGAVILWLVRLPRVLGSMLCGAALAVSGAVIQSVLANPLASPSVIGVNAGAGLAVTVCAALGIAGGCRSLLLSGPLGR